MKDATVGKPARKTGDYSKVVQEGHYEPPASGHWGKHDNVRLQWENQVCCLILQPILRDIRRRLKGSRGVRIVDLGCGSGEGWELITHTPDPTAADHVHQAYIFRGRDIDSYYGYDLCDDMIQAARERYGPLPQAHFDVGDMSRLELGKRGVPACDLYYSSYGSPSHLDDEGLRRMLIEINEHREGPAVVVLDLLGQYSPEWPRYWGYSEDGDTPRMKPYTMTWLYPPAEQQERREEFADYKLRFWGGEECEAFLRGVMGGMGISRYGIQRYDRSILVGRHMATKEFNPQAPNIRIGVNRLFDFNARTASKDIECEFEIPADAPKRMAGFLEKYQRAWNGVVDVFRHCFEEEADAGQTLRALDREVVLPDGVHASLEHFIAQAAGIGWLKPADPRSSALEPQFALLLRQLEFQMQEGLGCGHGLVMVLELE